MQAMEPSEILVKTEKITLVLKAIGGGKIRCRLEGRLWLERAAAQGISDAEINLAKLGFVD